MGIQDRLFSLFANRRRNRSAIVRLSAIGLCAFISFGCDIDDDTSKIKITSAPVQTACVGSPYYYRIKATGEPTPSLSVTDIPVWLSFDGIDTLSGTPTLAGLSGTLVVTAKNGKQTDAIQSFAIDVSAPPSGAVLIIDLLSDSVVELALAPTDILTDNNYRTTKMAFRLIPAGSFEMGDQTGRGDIDEDPVHIVNLSESFYIGIFEVTQAQWELVMGDTPSLFTAPGTDAFPVEQVSFDDIQGFLSTISSRIGRTVLLPTEAQWEYACKAGTSTDWSFGSVADPAYMWTAGQSETTNIVGLKAPNFWGLYDMHGNVWEWCSDWYDKTYYSSAPLVDPENSTPGAYRVYRGGGWTSSSHLCRSANRVRNLSTSRFPFLGFRCVAVQ